MFHFPSGKPITYKPLNKYTHNRKASQRLSIEHQSYIDHLYTHPILDLTIEELEQLLYSQ